MRYGENSRVKYDASRVALGSVLDQRQDSLTSQIQDLRILANYFGLYDAAYWIRDVQK